MALVSNAWRAFQLINLPSDITTVSFKQLKSKLEASKIKLTKFCFDLSMALIRSADNVNILDAATLPRNINATLTEELDFNVDPSTLKRQMESETWPIRYKLEVFNRNHNFIELRLTYNNEFPHHCKKLISNHGKTHCALCYHHQTQYGCTVRKVLLCRIPTFKVLSNGEKIHRDSYYKIYHSCKDIEERRGAFSSHYNKGRRKQKTRSNDCCQIKSPLTAKKRKKLEVLSPIMTEARRKRQQSMLCDNSTGSLQLSNINESKLSKDGDQTKEKLENNSTCSIDDCESSTDDQEKRSIARAATKETERDGNALRITRAATKKDAAAVRVTRRATAATKMDDSTLRIPRLATKSVKHS